MSDDPPSGKLPGEQLPLFSVAAQRRRRPHGIPAEIARASVSPGWWPVVGPLWVDEEAIVVTGCREVHGALHLALVGASELQLDPARDPRAEEGDEIGAASVRDLSSLADQLVRLCAQTCGCCGQRPAGPRTCRGGLRYVLCECCFETIEGGVPLLVAADAYWRLDGARRLSKLRGAGASLPPVAPRGSSGHRGHGATATASDTAKATTRESFAPLGPSDLRDLVRTLRSSISGEIVGHENAVARLALYGALHVGGGLTHGQRALIVGSSGTGKSSLVRALCRSLLRAGYDLPLVTVDAVELTSPGWSGAPSVHELISTAIGDRPHDSPWARRAVIVIDEIHHVGVAPAAQLTGNMAAKRAEVLASLLGLLGHGTLKVGPDHRSWNAQDAMVLALGAFEGLLDPNRRPTVADLGRAGLPVELASRFHDVVLLPALGEGSLAELLRRWPAMDDMRRLCERLGLPVIVHPETISRAARAVTAGCDGATARTAGGWMVSAIQDALVRALDDPTVTSIEIAPDSLRIPRALKKYPPGDSADGDGQLPAERLS